METTVLKSWSRFVRFLAEDGTEYGGELEEGVDIGLALLNGPIPVRVLSDPSPLSNASFTGEVKPIHKLLPPLSATEISSIRCVGLNYTGHAAELKMKIPTAPEVFMKPSTSVTGPSDPIFLPTAAPRAVDGEVELAVVIGKDCRDVDTASALDYILGYTVANDVTCRDVQDKGSQWCFAKGFDTFCPLGPALVSTRALHDPQELKLQTVLDGQVLQNGNTANMIFSVAEIISHISQGTTLPKGTVVLTGTPEGIGHSYKPPRYLQSGASLRVGIQDIGTLTNSIEYV